MPSAGVALFLRLFPYLYPPPLIPPSRHLGNALVVKCNQVEGFELNRGISSACLRPY